VAISFSSSTASETEYDAIAYDDGEEGIENLDN
jgi:hypothetical protein